ncbi:MAG: aldo/keto reductase [Rhizobiaceae bacterium]|jgi:aryl-alcohol dehydrogenase-like predicted oxidoreductase|nr:aldo/keto reductase [Rhizobiaceae bacterium]
MITRELWDGTKIPALGLGCWAIGGPFFAGETPLGWGRVDDAESIAAIHCAVDLGIRFFDTAQVYGAGHSETVLGRALADRPDIKAGTKIGIAFNAETRQVIGENISPAAIRASVEASLTRLQRERIDLVHLHLNALPVDDAEAVFDCLGEMRAAGMIDAFGWSTDFPDRAAAFAQRPGFVSVQHAMNVFFKASELLPVIENNRLLSINRSPLAMGLLGGKYGAGSNLGGDDIRGQTMDWMAYFKGGTVAETYARQLAAVRDLLCSDGRTLAQGAIGWLWARSSNTLPIPGFRTVAQVRDLAGALAKGPLNATIMAEIEQVILREPEGPARER